MKGIIKRFLPRSVKFFLGMRSSYCKQSYSQEGEDRILYVLLGLNDRKRSGFYVDVGAHHPERFSNTRLFYLNGWCGINIDAMPGSMRQFSIERPRDINLEAAVSEKSSSLTFYEFNEPALNGFSKEVAATRDQTRGWKILRETTIKTTRLEELLEKHLPVGQTIDFISVDVEGLDLEVLKSNNWTKFRPMVVLVEDDEGSVFEQNDVTKISAFLKAQGYIFCCKTLLTSFFVDLSQVEATPMGLRTKSSTSL